MQRRSLFTLGLLGGGAAILALAGWRQYRKGPPLPADVAPVSEERLAEIYARPAPVPDHPIRVFHLGHSLVSRDMPAMLAQLAGPGHRYESQLGWGTPLRAHWEPRVDIMGFDVENAHPHFRPAREALESGDYDAVVLTEMVEIRDAIRWHASPAYLAKWAELARKGRPDVRVCLFETWHGLDTPEGWLDRLDADLPRYWEGVLLRGAAARAGGAPIYLIPGGQVMARAARAAEAGQLPGLTRREDFFARDAQGQLDPIHPGDTGNFLMALVHHAVLRPAEPHDIAGEILRADGTVARLPPVATRRALWQIARDVVRAMPQTGRAAG